MGLASSHFDTLNQDLMVDIMSRLDGCSLTAAASTCGDLRDAARDQGLWQRLCHHTWPSTSMTKSPFQTAASDNRGFKRLYSDAFPLLLYDMNLKRIPIDTTLDNNSLLPYKFTSLVDIYYRGNCIFSKVVESTTGACSETLTNSFLNYPFKLDLLDTNCAAGDHTTTNLLPYAITSYDQREDDMCNKITQDIRLSWILLKQRKGEAVNISSWKPLSVLKSNYSTDDMEFTIYFGSIITAEDGIIPHRSAECVITAKGKLMIEQRCISWTEISLVIKDIDGSHLNGEQSMRAINQALISTSRSIDHRLVERGYQQFQKQKLLVRLRAEQQESIANILGATVAIATLLGICYACTILFGTTTS